MDKHYNIGIGNANIACTSDINDIVIYDTTSHQLIPIPIPRF